MVLSQQQYKIVLRFKHIVLGWEQLRVKLEALISAVRNIEQDYTEASLHTKDEALLSCIVRQEKRFFNKFDMIAAEYLDLDKKTRFLVAEVEKSGIFQLSWPLL